MRQRTHRHVVLLGDSIFDNGAYTGTEPDVIAHLCSILPDGWAATLCAVDGSTTLDLAAQLPRVPPEASHLVVSIGGNDALLNADLLDTEVRSTAEALELFAERIQDFEASYRKAITAVLRLGRATVVCSIYNGNLPDPGQARAARVGSPRSTCGSSARSPRTTPIRSSPPVVAALKLPAPSRRR
jgi:hypothetical protein